MYNIIRRTRFYKLKSLIVSIVETRNLQTLSQNDIPKVVTGDIRKLLRQKGIPVQDGFTSVTTKCTICANEKDDQKKNESKLYVNKTTGIFFKINPTRNQSISLEEFCYKL